MDRWAGVPHVDEARVRAEWRVSPPRDLPAGPGSGPQSPQEAHRLALVARHTDDAIVIYARDGRIDWVNDAFVRMTGFSFDEAVGVRRLDLVRGPFTRTPAFKKLVRDLDGCRAASVEFVTRTRDGGTYWVGMEVRPAIQDGEVVGLIGVERDITSRRQAEERAKQSLRRAESLGTALRHEKQLLSAVLGTIPHLVWWKDTELRHVGANAAYLTFRGLNSLAEVTGRREDQLEGADGSGKTLVELEAAVVASREAIADRTVALERPDGQHTFLVSVLPHYEGDRFVGVIGIGADVSQVADLERQLAQASRLESIGQLAAGIAHEINTPVQYVSDNTRFVADTFGDVLTGLHEVAALADGSDSDADAVRAALRAVLDRLDLEFVADEVPSALTQSLEGLERVGGIVRAMKDFSHPGQGRSEVDLNRVIETTVQVSRNEWKYVAEVVLEVDRAMNQVPCFEGELKQVLLNVIVNAAQAIASGREQDNSREPGKIVISTARRGDEALIKITDNGIGMDEVTKAKVFDPFFTTKGVGKGTGQGMTLAHNTIVGKHGGRIEIDSAIGRGTTFTIALPYEVPSENAEASGDQSDPVNRE